MYVYISNKPIIKNQANNDFKQKAESEEHL